MQHLGRDNEVDYLLKNKITMCIHDENYYIILRNSAHYYNYDEAKRNLLIALDYFSSNKHTAFTVATIQNNLAVINIWKGNYEEANQYLKPAIRTLEQIYSNEVFEPYCNKSIMHLMCREYDTAYEYAKKALENCPSMLTLDIIMLKIHLIIIKLCQQQLTVEKALCELEQLCNQYTLIEDPWYEFQLLYNRNQLAKLIQREEITLTEVHKHYITDYYNAKTKFYILEQFQIHNFQIELCLGLSPNWRY